MLQIMVPWFAPTVTSTYCNLPGYLGATGPRYSNGIGEGRRSGDSSGMV